MSKLDALQISVRAADAALTPDHKRFNSLIRQIEKARGTLSAWHEQILLFRQAYVQLLDPLRRSLTTGLAQWVHALDSLLEQPGWSRNERKTLRQLLCEAAGALLNADEDDAIKALFDKHSAVKFDTEKEQELQALREMTEIFTGLDLGDGADIRSEEDIVDRLHEEMLSRAEAEQAHKAQRTQQRRKTQAQLRREGEAQLVTQSIRDVYRKLVSALHPDRELDAEVRERKNELMQKVNRAYEAKDLLTLLEVQLQVEGVNLAQPANVSQQRLRHYNKVLAEQLTGLKMDIESTSAQFCSEFNLDSVNSDPLKLGGLIQSQAQMMRAEQNRQRRELRMFADGAATKQWLKRHQQQMREAARYEDFF